MIFPIAREWVEGDTITLEAPDFVDFGERSDIRTVNWDNLKEEMINNFNTKDEDLKRFQQNDEKVYEDELLSSD